MGWGFVWLMLVLKIPIGMLLWLVWWAVRQVPDEFGEPQDGDGGSQVERERDPRRPPPPPPTPFDRRPRRRGPHGEPPVDPPPRVRTRVTRPRTREQ
jgi:hypothetical protein